MKSQLSFLLLVWPGCPAALCLIEHPAVSSCGGKQNHPSHASVHWHNNAFTVRPRCSVCVCIYSRSLLGLHWDDAPWSASLSNQAPPAGAMQLLPKRPIMEKNNGAAATVFNPSMFHYQQALANMQLQQPAFIPTGEPPQTLAWLKHHLTHWFQKGSRTTPGSARVVML